MKVCKFGGTSVGTVERMKHVATLIKDATPKIVVLSATAGTTNHLEEIAANLFNREIEQAHDRITRLEFQFIEFANGLLTDEKLKREAIDYILDRFQQLWKFTKDSFTSVEEKEVLAQGELISTALMHFYLRELKVPNVLLCAFDFMRIGPDNEPDLEYIEQKLREQLACHPGINLFITQGFICKNAYNETDNLKRGGSDYTASLIRKINTGSCSEIKSTLRFEEIIFSHFRRDLHHTIVAGIGNNISKCFCSMGIGPYRTFNKCRSSFRTKRLSAIADKIICLGNRSHLKGRTHNNGLYY